jgi:anaerobic ribonucleoside-triphosphate reductase activating protein
LKLNLSRIHFPVTALGFGRRIGIWFQGCSIRCDGCISVDTWAFDRGETTVDAVVTAVAAWAGEADGVTVSGGEPFDQPEALAALLRALRSQIAGDVLIFTGYAHERLISELDALSGLIDAVVTDPFDRRRPQTLAMRGSDNQRLFLLTPLGRYRYTAERLAAAPAVDVMFDHDGSVWLAGIPRRGDLSRIAAELAAAGLEISTSEASEQ